MQFTNSKNLYSEAIKHLPSGVSSPVRAFKSVDMTPIYIKKGIGSKIYDQDDNEFIDYVNNWGANILGHNNDKIKNAIKDALENSIAFGAAHKDEIKLASLIKKNYPFVDQVRFTNSGSEAVAGAIRLARAIKKKSKIIKFAGCYHGHADYLLVKAGSGALTYSNPDSAGVPESFANETITIEYNNLEQVEQIAEERAAEIAAIIVEPIAGNMGMIMPRANFLSGLRNVCDKNGILLIVDEVMTGYRTALGGCCQLFNLEADILVLGKIIGGGLPIGCFASSYENMNLLAPAGPVYQAGTFSGNPVVMAAGIAALEELQGDEIYYDLSNMSAKLTQGLFEIARNFGLSLQTNNAGGMFGFFFSENKIENLADTNLIDRRYFAALFKELIAGGVYIAPSAFESGFITAMHSEQDIEFTLNAFNKALFNLANQNIYPKHGSK